MSKSNKNIKKYLGYKFYKVLEDDSVELFRVIGLDEFNNKVTIKYDNGKTNTVNINSLTDYTPLVPYGFCMFNRLYMKESDTKDVMISAYRMMDIKLDINEPFCICRQSVNDFFLDMIHGNSDYVGVCATRDNIPEGVPYHYLAAADEILGSCMVNFYLDDTLEDILSCIPASELKYIDEIQYNNYISHMKSINPAYIEDLDNNLKDHGWCKNLQTLLEDNNFITDLDDMRNIVSFDFNMSEFLEREEVEDDEVFRFNRALTLFFNNLYKINTTKTMVIKFDYDINLGEFNNSNYILIRDNTNILYLVVYITEGEYLEVELEEELNKLGVGDKLRLSYYNKYNTNLA